MDSRVSAEVLAAFPGTPTRPVAAGAFAGVTFRRPMDDAAVASIVGFLRAEFFKMEAVGLRDVVIGLSGGLDSVVAARLCQLAADHVRDLHAVTVDLARAGEGERVSAIARCAAHLGIKHVVISGGCCRQAVVEASPKRGTWSDINTDTRLIQAFVFRAADAHAASVVSTTDLSERLLGRHTECFYGQLEPMGCLYKTEVRELATTLGVLGYLADERPGCEDYWYDDEVLGVDYDVVDPILYLLGSEGRSPEWIARKFGIEDVDWVRRVARRIELQPRRLDTRRPSCV